MRGPDSWSPPRGRVHSHGTPTLALGPAFVTAQPQALEDASEIVGNLAHLRNALVESFSVALERLEIGFG